MRCRDHAHVALRTLSCLALRPRRIPYRFLASYVLLIRLGIVVTVHSASATMMMMMYLFRTTAAAARSRPAVRVVLPNGCLTSLNVVLISHGDDRRLTARRRVAGRPISSCFSTTSTIQLPMKPGTPIPGLTAIYPTSSKDPTASSRIAPVALPREEYPAWVNELTRPLPTLAKLRTMKIDEASDKDMKRYLKLVRKAKIKSNNESRAKS
jgi:hypothetical protein